MESNYFELPKCDSVAKIGKVLFITSVATYMGVEIILKDPDQDDAAQTNCRRFLKSGAVIAIGVAYHDTDPRNHGCG